MTKQEFDQTNWVRGMRCNFEGRIYNIICLNFQKYSVAIDVSGESTIWLNCEEISVL